MLVWGTSGRQFESGHPDCEIWLQKRLLWPLFLLIRII